jgi:integrase
MACVVKRRGKWVVDFRDQHGKRRWETYETRMQADTALAKRIGQVKGGEYRNPADLPTFETVANDWLNGRKDRAPGTVDLETRQVRLHFVPAFGARRIDTITPVAVEQFRNEKRDAGWVPSTINQVLQNLSRIFRYAVKHGYIAKNPAHAETVDRVKRQRIADELEDAVDPRSVLNAEQAHAVIAAADPGLYRTFIMTAILTGARCGELSALDWDHVDLEARKMKISRSLAWDRSGDKAVPVFGPPKTDSSYRTLVLVPELVQALREWRMRQRVKDGLVFPNHSGAPIHNSQLNRALRRALDQCPDAPRVSIHELRHTFASLLLSMNKPVTQVAKLMGHKDPSITLTVYAHWFEGASSDQDMADLANAVLCVGSKTVAAATA